jgi:hypothetical protein
MMTSRDTAANHWALNLLQQPTILLRPRPFWEKPEVTRVAKAAGRSTLKSLTWHKRPSLPS